MLTPQRLRYPLGPQHAPQTAAHTPHLTRHRHHTTPVPVAPDERPDIIERICARIEQGALTRDAADAEGIDERTLRRWVSADAALADRYTRARSLSADALAEQAVAIATNGRGPDGERYEDAQERRLAYDALRWLAGKRRPRDYGDRQQVEVSGGIEHLHLDALRSTITAKASIDNDLPVATLPSGQPIDTEEAP